MKMETPMETWFHCLPNFALDFVILWIGSLSPFFFGVWTLLSGAEDVRFVEQLHHSKSPVVRIDPVGWRYNLMTSRSQSLDFVDCFLGIFTKWTSHVGIIGICPFTVGKKNINLHGRGNLGFGLIFRGRVRLQGVHLGCNPWNTYKTHWVLPTTFTTLPKFNDCFTWKRGFFQRKNRRFGTSNPWFWSG